MAGRIAYLGNISAQGLVLNLDAAIQGSYPKTGTLWTDISGNNNNGTLTNGPAYTGSDYGAIVFDGTDDYVNLPTMYSPPIISLNTWFKTSVVPPYQMLITSDGSIPNTRNFQYRLASGKLEIIIFETDSTFSLISSSISSSNGSWTNTTATYDRSYLKLYINGTPVNQTSSTFPINDAGQTGEFAIGTRRLSNGPTDFFSGSIANAQIYNQPLSQFQVWQNFNAYKSRYGIPDIVTDGLVLNLDAGNPYSYLSGSSGTTWTNTVAVSSSISGTLVNGTTYSNGAMVFDGVDDFVEFGDVFDLGTNNLTVNQWLYFANNNTNQVTLSKALAGGQAYRFATALSNTGKLYAFMQGNGGPDIVPNGSTTIPANTWIMATFVFNRASSIVLYYNGVQESLTGDATISQWNGLNFQSPNPFRLATYTADNNTGVVSLMNGRIASTQVYFRALTQAEITQNFNALRGRYGI
jgi:hypothetical protein